MSEVKKKASSKDIYGIALFNDLQEQITKCWDRFTKVQLDEHGRPDDFEQFDYPDYCGIDRKISAKLTGDVVDHIQELQNDIHEGYNKYSKKEFFNKLLKVLFPMGVNR